MTRYGFLSTYPPTRCGLATFTEALAGALVANPARDATIVRTLDVASQMLGPVVLGRVPTVSELVSGDDVTLRAAVRTLNMCDVAIVQHEYGIYGGPDGDEVVTLLDALSAPAIVVLHTVLPSPTPHQRTVLESVCALAAIVVVMTENAHAILTSTYRVSDADVRVIPHGVPVRRAAAPPQRDAAKRVLTWGLLSPGKGIEWGIRAMAQLRGTASDAPVEYVIAGQTHPKVLARDGEQYRDALARLVGELGVGDTVSFDDKYLDADQLADLVASADVVLLPYDSHDQATSGVLVEAIAAGIPVVATGFPHAVELLGSGAGLIAAHRDPASMAEALRTILSADETRERMRAAALRDAHALSWPVVAEQYRALATRLAKARAA